ncbi:hypothetical protein NHM07_07830 [Bacillus subtilis]|nr:hypothetical protein [Bacillus subtilis]MCO8148472.1 hypothetical protein [Bacillus subtilis]MDQ4710897.1 hypothetical protein [Bacillus subtilis]MEC2179912.1 hypothetical protein [Bacillus subtilis]
MINFEALKYMRLLVENRGYESEYIFSTKYGGEVKQASKSWAGYFCSNVTLIFPFISDSHFEVILK